MILRYMTPVFIEKNLGQNDVQTNARHGIRFMAGIILAFKGPFSLPGRLRNIKPRFFFPFASAYTNEFQINKIFRRLLNASRLSAQPGGVA